MLHQSSLISFEFPHIPEMLSHSLENPPSSWSPSSNTSLDCSSSRDLSGVKGAAFASASCFLLCAFLLKNPMVAVVVVVVVVAVVVVAVVIQNSNYGVSVVDGVVSAQ
jgi:hypothetical protein